MRSVTYEQSGGGCGHARTLEARMRLPDAVLDEPDRRYCAVHGEGYPCPMCLADDADRQDAARREDL